MIKSILKRVIPVKVQDSLHKAKTQITLITYGIIFTYFRKKYVKYGVTINIPFDLTSLKFRGRFYLNNYEEKEAKYVNKYLPSDSKVLELGGCLGYISCLANKKLINKKDHVVLEANPNLIPYLKKNKHINNCHFSIENVVISTDRTVDFYFHELIVGGSTKRITNNKHEISGTTLSNLSGKYGIEFDVLIMDIEGGELEFLRKFSDNIDAFKLIFIETHPFANILTTEEVLECESILIAQKFKKFINDGNYQVWKNSQYYQHSD